MDTSAGPLTPQQFDPDSSHIHTHTQHTRTYTHNFAIYLYIVCLGRKEFVCAVDGIYLIGESQSGILPHEPPSISITFIKRDLRVRAPHTMNESFNQRGEPMSISVHFSSFIQSFLVRNQFSYYLLLTIYLTHTHTHTHTHIYIYIYNLHY